MRKRNYNIDVLKGIAILSVILLHTIPWDYRLLIGSPYHIWQAVPVFMLIVGYNFAKSAKSKNQETLADLYQVDIIKKRIVKILKPFIFILLARLVIQLFLTGNLKLVRFLTGVFFGDITYGGYYIPVMIQAILLCPLMYFLMRKNLNRNTFWLLVSAYVLDWLVMLADVPGGLYRILIVRYIFAITLGIWLGLNEKPINYKLTGFLAVISLIYITRVYYFDITTTLESYWQAQHPPAYFWTLLLVMVGLYAYEAKPSQALAKPFIWMGQSSYHIFLFQMLYFWFLSQISFTGILGLEIIINTLICVVLGKILEKFI